MKKWFLLALTVLCLSIAPGFAEAGEGNRAEWTVMFYMCGSDLESKYEFASQNLMEIVQAHDLSLEYNYYAGLFNLDEYKQELKEDRAVHVVIETGGCRAWHNEEQEIRTTETPIRTDVLQRWSYDPYESVETSVIRLQESIPLASMSDPETLTDFIRWSAENYPAEKYLLVMWDHGGGSRTGILVDELFNNDIMYLYELSQALGDSGVHLEAVLFDACLMANIETAYSIRDYADWMIASEEVVTGAGTAIQFWLSELCNRPAIGGDTLGRIICDSAQEKCADLGDEQGAQLLTWSVIRLSEMDEVAECMEQAFRITVEKYTEDPALTSQYLKHHATAEHYGSMDDRMIDLSDMFYNAPPLSYSSLAWRNELLDALEKAVVYCVRGSGRARSKGLSFCYAVGMSAEELDIYARNCPSPHYLAMLDAVTPWTAPDSLYENVERLPEINDLEGYDIVLERTIGEHGVPGVILVSSDNNVSQINSYCYVMDEASGMAVRLGYVPAVSQTTTDGRVQQGVWEPWFWPCVEKQFCCVDMIEYIYGESLYEIPVQIDSDVWFLRCGFTPEKGYEVYGVWSGINTSTKMFNRNVTSVSKMTGQSYRMLYPVCDLKTRKQLDEYQYSASQTMPRNLTVDFRQVPPGTNYIIQYVVEDMFSRRIPLESVRVCWDGESLTLVEGEKWEGTVQLFWN